jgi:hypothetical protein
MTMRFAVVGDVHGHLALLYAILACACRESGEGLDLVLQVGDLGAFPDHARLDGPTRKRAERDPEELGFAEFAGPRPPATPLDPRPPLVFIPGNHEDFAFLGECALRVPESQAVYPVAGDGRLLALRSGEVWNFTAGSVVLRVAGISGVDNRRHKQSRHPLYHLSENDALKLIARGRGAFDLLLSHDCPEGTFDSYRGTPAGSPSLRWVIEEVEPRLACFGHYGKAGEWSIGATRVLALPGCGYTLAGGLVPGAIALARWDGEHLTAERLAADWLAAATRTTWRHWRP